MARITLHSCFLVFAQLIATLALAPPASAQAKETVLYSFQAGSDGSTPVGSIVIDKASNLYGATVYATPCSNSLQCGSVYQLSPPQQQGGAWTETTLYNFQGHDKGDGGSPEGGLIQDVAGNLYGTTAYGGTGLCILLGTSTGCGTVYELVRPTQPAGKWKEKVLYSFQGNQDGQFPIGDLVLDKHGNLYGATWFGGGKGTSCNPLYPYCGTIFQLSPPRTTSKSAAWTEKVLYSFQGLDTGDGGQPNGGLLFDKAGAIYGTTFYGGSNGPNCISFDGCGIIFQLTPPANHGGTWTEGILYRFQNGTDDGARPNGNLILFRRGIYGTTLGGGEAGTVFKLKTNGNGSWFETVLYMFQSGYAPSNPEGGLSIDRNGKILCTAGSGGPDFDGTIFQLNPGPQWALTDLYDFQGPPTDGAFPVGKLAFDNRGNAYGVTQLGGSGQSCGFGGCGTVFQLTQ
ncbi:MAG: hypothetical protein LAO09_19790 [Acidobacteriia bacterium]|nr:hypothetical protein [Terriglobia bacterium]